MMTTCAICEMMECPDTVAECHAKGDCVEEVTP